MEAAASSDETLAAVFAQLKPHTVALLDLLRNRGASRPSPATAASSLLSMAAFLRSAPASALQLCFEYSPSTLPFSSPISFDFGFSLLTQGLVAISDYPRFVLQLYSVSTAPAPGCGGAL
jgi:hypothetical protein